MLNTTINFKCFREKYSWTLEHNLDEHGLSLDAAFVNWSARYRGVNPSIEDFCKYVVSKDDNLICNPKN